MTDKTKSLRVRRLHDLHEQWCTLSRDVIELGSSIGCVLASAHESIRPGPLGDDVDPIMGMSGRDIREYLICSHIGHAEEENGHYELSASRDPIPFLHIYNEFEIIPRDSLSIPVRYYSAEKSRVSVVDAYYWLPEDRFRYWEYFIFSKLNRFNFRTIGMRFCELSRMSAIEYGCEGEVPDWIFALAQERIEYANAVFCRPVFRESSVDLSKLPSSYNCPLEHHESIGVGPFAVATFKSNVALESAKLIESMIDALDDPIESVGVSEFIGPKSPSEWEKLYGLSWRTIRRRINRGTIRGIEINTKSWKIAAEDVPKLTTT